MARYGPIEKAWFMVPVEYSSNERDIMALIECTPVVYRRNKKGMVLWKTGFLTWPTLREKYPDNTKLYITVFHTNLN